MFVVDVQSDTLCVLYERATGKITYAHRAITLSGGEVRDATAIEATARQLAAERGRDPSALDALHLAGNAMDEVGVYKVNINARSLVFQTFKEAGADLGMPGIAIGQGGGIGIGPWGPPA